MAGFEFPTDGQYIAPVLTPPADTRLRPALTYVRAVIAAKQSLEHLSHHDALRGESIHAMTVSEAQTHTVHDTHFN